MIESKIFLTKCRIFISNLFNGIFVFNILFFMVGIILRFVPNDDSSYKASRIIMSIDIFLWFFNFLHTYTSIKILGPKLIMIRKMLFELLVYVFIVLVFIAGFGVASHALNYHNIPASLTLAKSVFLTSVFIIPQEYYIRNRLLKGEN